MTSENMGEIVDTLRNAESRLRAQHGAATQTAKNLADELRKVEKAIAALLGQERPRSPAQPKTESPSGEEVVEYLASILKNEGPLKEPELRQKLNERAQEQGKSRKGLHFRFKKAIKDERFNWNGARWDLR